MGLKLLSEQLDGGVADDGVEDPDGLVQRPLLLKLKNPANTNGDLEQICSDLISFTGASLLAIVPILALLPLIMASHWSSWPVRLWTSLVKSLRARQTGTFLRNHHSNQITNLTLRFRSKKLLFWLPKFSCRLAERLLASSISTRLVRGRWPELLRPDLNRGLNKSWPGVCPTDDGVEEVGRTTSDANVGATVSALPSPWSIRITTCKSKGQKSLIFLACQDICFCCKRKKNKEKNPLLYVYVPVHMNFLNSAFRPLFKTKKRNWDIGLLGDKSSRLSSFMCTGYPRNVAYSILHTS